MQNKFWRLVILMMVCGLLMMSAALADDSSNNRLKSDLKAATALLYRVADEGDGDIIPAGCSMVAFSRSPGNVYRFLTSAECVVHDGTLRLLDSEAVEALKDLEFYLVFSEPGPKVFYPARITQLFFNQQSNEGGIIVVEATLFRHIPVIPLVTGDLKINERIVNFAPTSDLTDSLLNGRIVKIRFRNPLVVNYKNNSSAILLRLGDSKTGQTDVSNPVIISRDKKTIIAILVGMVKYHGKEMWAAVPINKILLSTLSKSK